MKVLVASHADLKEIGSLLEENLPWSPFDYIRGISLTGDKALYAGQLTAPTRFETDDLRILCRLSEDDNLAVFAERLPWDSDFFGYGVAKLHGIFPLNEPFYRPYADYAGPLEAVLELARRRGIQYFFAVIDPRDLAVLRALGEQGFCLIETRVHYHMDIRNFQYHERYPVRPATPDDIDILGRTAARMVNPFDRFHADPFISPELADRLMFKWVKASIQEGFADIVMVPDSPQPEALCTVRYHKDKWSTWGVKLAQPAFTAVGHNCKGWFLKLISEIHYHLREIGLEHSYYISQVTNSRVIAVLERLGYRFGGTSLTLRKLV
jgi:hypothetical protein